ncbi:MAG TPA: hypothetical protein VIV06_05400, partial [Candidatus Limnocylindrales bacterium]
GLTHEERRRLHELAVTIGRAAGLENAATCEFLREPDGACWFLEVNTRLQVEHPVTELVVGLDLVAEQFRIAAGESLSAAARAAAARATEPIGHAIEVRLLAEDPGRAFAPSPGRITRWSLPGGPGVRVDTATEQGDIVPPDYDPLLAKIVVHAMDRPATVRRLARALAEVDVGGVQTTLPFSRWVAAHPAFEADRLSTDWVAEHWNGSHDTRSPALRAALLAAGLAALSEERRGPTSEDPVAMPTPGTRGIATAGTGTGVNPDGEAPDSWKLAGRRSALERWPR